MRVKSALPIRIATTTYIAATLLPVRVSAMVVSHVRTALSMSNVMAVLIVRRLMMDWPIFVFHSVVATESWSLVKRVMAIAPQTAGMEPLVLKIRLPVILRRVMSRA
jgi:hypothetical protein